MSGSGRPAPVPKRKSGGKIRRKPDLTAAIRMAVLFGWHESVGNHFSAAVSGDGSPFLMNPKWRHFSEIKASDLLLLAAEDDREPADRDELVIGDAPAQSGR